MSARVVGASIVRGESAESGVDTGIEEVVTGAVPVSEDRHVVEQAVQGQPRASQPSGFVPGNESGPRQQQV